MENRVCTECPCEELKRLEKELGEFQTFIALDLAKERKRIARLESDIIETKKTFAQVTSVRTEGTWGIAQKRGDLIYARLLSMRNGNGKVPFLPTGDIKKILGVTSYSQAKAAMSECMRKHLDIRVVERGRNKVGLELLNEVPVRVGASAAPEERKKAW